jgi:hypothetical protein
VTTGQIYKGSIAFIILQLIMVAVVISMPKLVMGGIDQGVKIDADSALETMGLPSAEPDAQQPELGASQPEGSASDPEGDRKDEEDDAMKALEEALRKEQAGKK